MNFDEQACLSVDPFAGEYGDSEVKLEDKIVTARKSRQCHTCAEQIEPGTKIRVMAEAWDGSVWRQAWCSKCCTAMAKSAQGDDKEIHERSDMGRGGA
jgi:ribosomal protein L24E